jgi:hypothetical protein
MTTNKQLLDNIVDRRELAKLILDYGHNDECLFCGFKDKLALAVMEATDPPPPPADADETEMEMECPCGCGNQLRYRDYKLMLVPRIDGELPPSPPADAFQPGLAEQWCWREPNSEIAHGPLASREDAIDDAKMESESRTVMIGNCVWPDAVTIAGETADVDFLLEQMEEYACDNGLGTDDSIFDLKAENSKEAQEGLKNHLRAWAAEFLATPSYWHSEREEEVEINPEGDHVTLIDLDRPGRRGGR